MSYADLAREMVKRHEGLRLKPYTDTVGKLTIGYGRNLTDVGLSDGEAEVMLSADLMRAINIAIHFVSVLDWRDLSDARKAVLIDMAFNTGRGLDAFSRLRTALLRHDYDAAAAEMLASRWAGQVGDRAKELASLMRTGEVPNDPATV